MDQTSSKLAGFPSGFPTKTQGEIQTAICDVISSVEHEHIGRGPKEIRAQLIGDLLVVRLVVNLGDVLTPAEQQLVRSVSAENADNDSTGTGDHGELDAEGSWNTDEGIQVIDSPALSGFQVLKATPKMGKTTLDKAISGSGKR